MTMPLLAMTYSVTVFNANDDGIARNGLAVKQPTYDNHQAALKQRNRRCCRI